MTFPRGLRALNQPEYRRFFGAQLVAQIGSWMQSVAQAWLVLQLTDSPLLLGLIGTLQFGPVLLFSIFSGAVADRFVKRRILIATQTTLACQAVGLGALAWSGHAEYWHVAALAMALGFANVIEMPARQSYVADIVGRADLINAVALNSASFNAARIVGPAVAGVMIAKLGVVPAFFINGVGHLVVVAALFTLTTTGQPASRSITGVLADIAEGVRHALSTPRIRSKLRSLEPSSTSTTSKGLANGSSASRIPCRSGATFSSSLYTGITRLNSGTGFGVASDMGQRAAPATFATAATVETPDTASGRSPFFPSTKQGSRYPRPSSREFSSR